MKIKDVKIGMKIIGNDLANKYIYTKKGWVGVVECIQGGLKLQTERFGAVMQFAYIWNLYDLFSLTLLGLAGNLPLLVKLDDLNEQIEREIFLKRGY